MGDSRKLEEIGKAMNSMKTQEDLADFLKDPENAQRLNSLVEDIRYALIDYQVRIPKRLTTNLSNICHRLRYNKKSTTKAVRRL